MKPGDAVFFEIAKPSSSRKAPKIKFQGHGFGILLGHVPPFQKDPPPEHLLRLMGTIGFMSFDDVANFLGDEMAAKCVKAFEDKYYGKIEPASVEKLVEQGVLPPGTTLEQAAGTEPFTTEQQVFLREREEAVKTLAAGLEAKEGDKEVVGVQVAKLREAPRPTGIVGVNGELL